MSNNNNGDLVSQAIAAIPLWKAFLDQKEAEQDAMQNAMLTEEVRDKKEDMSRFEQPKKEREPVKSEPKESSTITHLENPSLDKEPSDNSEPSDKEKPSDKEEEPHVFSEEEEDDYKFDELF